MVYCSLKETTYYESSANVLNYTIVDDSGNVIYYGHSIKNPKTGVNRINITEIIRDWLHSNLEDNWDILSNESGYVCQQKDAIRRFSLINGELILETYLVLLDYKDVFTGEDFILSEPINGKLDPRMKAFITQIHNASFNFDLIGSLVFTHIKQSRTYTVLCTDFSLVTASTQDDWFTVSKSGNSLIVEVQENDDEQRYGTIIIAYPVLDIVEYKTYTITQLKRDYENEYLTIRALDDGINVCLRNTDYFYDTSKNVNFDVYYRKNGGEWKKGTTYRKETAIVTGTTITLSSGDTLELYHRGVTSYYTGEHTYMPVSCNVRTLGGPTEIYGNVLSMFWGQDFAGKEAPNIYNKFRYLFAASSCVSAKNLVLQTDLTYCSYDNMFSDCTSLTTVPKLPATILSNNCYAGMFANCTSLQTAPELPARTLYKECYYGMFTNCTSLQTAPELPVTTLASGCYHYMFRGCTSLVNAPELPATTLAIECYEGMFYDCTSLQTAPELPASTLYSFCYKEMFRFCTSLQTAPVLPATTLESECYAYMFANCISLNYVKCLAQTFAPVSPGYAMSSTGSWLSGVSSTGTFVKKAGISWEIGASGIPEGWTVQEE